MDSDARSERDAFISTGAVEGDNNVTREDAVASRNNSRSKSFSYSQNGRDDLATTDVETFPTVPEEDTYWMLNGLLINPFRGKSTKQMADVADEFIQISRIKNEWHDCIRKGAFLAQNYYAFANEREDGLQLSREDQEALKQEDPKIGNKWDQPFILYALVVCCSLGAAVQGWDETAVNQAQIFYAADLGIPTGEGDSSREFNHPSIILGLVNCAPYLCCAVIGCWLTDPLNRYLGRRGTIFVSCIVSCVTCIAQAFVSSWPGLFAARFCLGFGIGPKSATIPIYAAESAPKEIRGSLVMQWQMWTAFGIMLGYVSGVVFQNVTMTDGLKWRLIVGSPCLLPIVVCAYVFTLPESPRWLLARARAGKTEYFAKAFRALRRLRRTPLQAARDLVLIYYQLEGEETIKKQRNRFVELFTVRRNRTALQAGLIVMFFQQFCGVNVLAYYSSLVFQRAGYPRNDALLASMGFGLINFFFAIPALRLIDTWGRRNLLISTFPFMAVFQLFTGLAFLATGTTRKALVTTGMYLFAVAYSVGEGPVPFTYSSECMQLYVRDLGMSMFTATTWFFNFLLAITFPRFLNAFGNTGAFAYYAAWCVIGWILIILFVPETGFSQSLEELDARFNIPTRVQAEYGWAEIRGFIKRKILREHATESDLTTRNGPPIASGDEKISNGFSYSADPRVPRKIPVDTEVEGLASVTVGYSDVRERGGRNRSRQDYDTSFDAPSTDDYGMPRTYSRDDNAFSQRRSHDTRMSSRDDNGFSQRRFHDPRVFGNRIFSG